MRASTIVVIVAGGYIFWRLMHENPVQPPIPGAPGAPGFVPGNPVGDITDKTAPGGQNANGIPGSAGGLGATSPSLDQADSPKLGLGFSNTGANSPKLVNSFYPGTDTSSSSGRNSSGAFVGGAGKPPKGRPPSYK